MTEAYTFAAGNISVGEAFATSHVNVLLPGRGRVDKGMGLPESGINRVNAVAAFFHEHNLIGSEAVIVSSGYKTPAERRVQRVYTPELGRFTSGIPEAVLYDRLLDEKGIPLSQRRIEAGSFDSVTNLAHSLDLLPKGPVAIAAQQDHLERFLERIAPRMLNPYTRPFIGLVVPETDPSNPETDSQLAKLFTRAITFGIHPESRNLERRVTRRAHIGWTAIKPLLLLRGQEYAPGEPTTPTA